MNKIQNMILSALIKRGVLYEARDVDIDVDIPMSNTEDTEWIRINVKAEHMKLSIDNDSRE